MITYNEIPAAIEQLQADLKELIALVKAKIVSDEPSDFVSRKELSKMLQVNMSTIHRWIVAKKIERICLGGRVYFNRKQIYALLGKSK